MPDRHSLFVDTSGWACYLDRSDPLHAAAVTHCERAVAHSHHLVTTNYVVAELVALLTTRLHLNRPQIITIIDALKTTPYVDVLHIDSAMDTAAWALLKARQDKEWSMVDAASFVVMSTYGMMDALTTDRHFSQAGYAQLLAR